MVVVLFFASLFIIIFLLSHFYLGVYLWPFLARCMVNFYFIFIIIITFEGLISVTIPK